MKAILCALLITYVVGEAQICSVDGVLQQKDCGPFQKLAKTCECYCPYKYCKSGLKQSKKTCKCEPKNEKCRDAYNKCTGDYKFDGINCACFPKCDKSEKCPGKQRRNLRTCECSCPYQYKCSKGTEWNAEQCKCIYKKECEKAEQSCPKGRWDVQNCKCHPPCQAPSKQKFPSCRSSIKYTHYGMQYPFWNKFTCKCDCRKPEEAKFCQKSEIFKDCNCIRDPKCELLMKECPPEQWDWPNCVCRDACPGGMNSKNANCEKGKFWDKKACKCTCQELKMERSYPQSYYRRYSRYGGYGGYGLYAGNGRRRRFNKQNEKYEFKLCPNQNKVWNENTCNCECKQKRGNCPETLWDDKSCKCAEPCLLIKECPPMQIFNTKKCACECRAKYKCESKHYRWDKDQCQCVLKDECKKEKKICPEAQWDSASCKCLQPCQGKSTVCPKRKFWDPKSCECRCENWRSDSCYSKSHEWNPDMCKCVLTKKCAALEKSCPAKLWNKYSCECLKPCKNKCVAPRSKQHPKTCKCECKSTKYCRPWPSRKFDKKTCKCVKKACKNIEDSKNCKPSFYWNSAWCQCESCKKNCKDGFEFTPGTCNCVKNKSTFSKVTNWFKDKWDNMFRI